MFFVKRMLLVFLVLCGLSVACVSSSSKTGSRDMSIGFAGTKGSVEFILNAHYFGARHATVYHSLGQKWLAYKNFPKAVDIILTLHIPKKGPGVSLQDINNGKYDAKIRYFAERVRREGRRITVRPLSEFNGKWYPWGVYRVGNTPDMFIPAWRRVVTLIRSETDLVKFDLNYNRTSAKPRNKKDGRTVENSDDTANGGSKVSDFASLYPGNEYVDSVSISTYNRCGSDDEVYKQPYSFAQEFRPAYDEVLSIVPHDMPIGVAETATTSLCGVDRVKWYEALFLKLENEFTRVTNVTFFFVTKLKGTVSNKREVHWELQTPEERKGFRRLLSSFRKRMNVAKLPEIKGKKVIITNGKTKVNGEMIAMPQIGDKTKMKYPWSVYANFESVLGDEYNFITNPATDEPFGEVGTRFRLSLKQAFLQLSPETGILFGPEFEFGLVASDNPNRWWDNAISGAVSLKLCTKTKNSYIDWGGICAFGKYEHKEYLVPVPGRLKGGVDTVGIGINLNIGGDWAD